MRSFNKQRVVYRIKHNHRGIHQLKIKKYCTTLNAHELDLWGAPEQTSSTRRDNRPIKIAIETLGSEQDNRIIRFVIANASDNMLLILSSAATIRLN